MTNKFTSPPPTDWVVAKLQVLLDYTNRLYQEGGLSLKEDIIDAYTEAMGLFVDSIDKSIVGVVYPIQAGMPADPVDYNVFSRAILQDLQVLFSQTKVTDSLVSANFNNIIALRDKVLSISRRITSKTADYLLYADPSLGEGFFFGERFNSARHIDIGSSLVEDEECLLNQEEGVVLLPLDGNPERHSVAKYTLNDSSNGELGNNHEAFAEPHSTLEALGDGEPDTWVEYERVTQFASSRPLVLDMTLTLGKESIVNHIHVLPVQFGTPTPPKILTLETSSDGKDYRSVKDEIPISDFFSEEEDDVFELSGKTSKYSGEGYFSFLPRRAKFVHIVIQQGSAYAIRTNTGEKLRYAIGLKDINIYGRKFKPKGSLVSKAISVNGDATKMSLWASENPTEKSVLADIRHDLSPDDGGSWYSVQPQGRDYVTYPEILNFNNSESDSISTGGEIPSVRHKIIMNRDADKFTGNVVLEQEKKSTVDLVPTTGLSPFLLELQNEPIPETVNASIPVYGSWSCPRERETAGLQSVSPPMDLDFIEAEINSATTDTIRIKLPYKNIPNLPHRLRVFVDGSQWSYSSTKDSDLSSLDEESRVYFLDRGGQILKFVHLFDSVKYGKLPGSGAKVQVCLDGDNPPMRVLDAGPTLMLSGSSDGFKKNVSIVTPRKLESLQEDTEEPLGSVETFVVPGGDGHKAISLNAGNQTEEEESASAISTGTIPPVYDTSEDSFWMTEYSASNTTLELSPTHEDRAFYSDSSEVREDGYVPFVDGYTEFLFEGSYHKNRWTFDPYSGVLYIGGGHRGNHSVRFTYYRRKLKVLSEEDWDYYRSPISGKEDTSRIVLKPSSVYQFEKTVSLSEDDRSASLTDNLFDRHDWWKQKIVRGSIKLSEGILLDDEDKPIAPVEVNFVDGETELTNTTWVSQAISAESGTLHSFQLDRIDSEHPLAGAPVFEVATEYPDAVQSNQFVSQVESPGDISSSGDWCVASNGTVTIKTASSGLIKHKVRYSFEDLNNGIDKRGLFSVDYENNNIHFGSGVAADNNVTFNVTMYSAFYNMSEVIRDDDIEEIDSDNNTIELKTEYAEKFLREPSPQNPAPRYVRVGYSYYEKSTESLKDLEPYFSPICKDIAIRAITKAMMGTF